MSWIGIDVGGTFTDAVVYDAARDELRSEKAPTTPRAPEEGVLNALDRLGIGLGDAERLIHGMTLATNTVLERNGAEVWVVTNRGFRDTLEIARTNRPVLYNIKTLKAPPLVPRQRILELDERRLSDGSVLRPADDGDIEVVIARLRDERAQAVAVCFLHSYANPESERLVAGRIGKALPDCFVTASADVLPEFREYERFSTAVLNAYTGPRVATYLTSLDRALAAAGYGRQVFIMMSNGGMFTGERAARFPVGTILSGPAGGVAAGAVLGEAIGERHLITYDMGGTSTDVCLLDDLDVPLTNEQFVADYPNRTPQIEINTVGAGGGSIAWLDSGPVLQVGPESAGAEPGPACYGRGGEQPTVTDANLALGRLNPEATFGGAVHLDLERSEAAIDALASRIEGLSRLDLAEGIVRIALARMVSAIKEISIGKGHDPRDFALLAYGGAGPLHAALIAEELEIPKVVIPPNPGNFSAYGAVLSDLRHDYVRTLHVALGDGAMATIETVFGEMEQLGRDEVAAERVDAKAITTKRACGMRYAGQSWELLVDLPESLSGLDQIAAAFHQAHERRYGHANSDDPVEIVNFRLAVIGQMSKPRLPEPSADGGIEAAEIARRPVYLDGEHRETAVYERSRLAKAAAFHGPAMIEEAGSVTLVPLGWRCVVESFGVLILMKDD
ncbi:MAG: hydantoinase/oxoprolinase family protein [Alphaproteobacteria bacterium]|jgi:N-methylhydantoinase A|nr:hydantoinase/oxoprolinase family protein [Alphaproteobacteria bacterium]